MQCVVCKKEFWKGNMGRYNNEWYCYPDLEEQLQHDTLMKGRKYARMSEVQKPQSKDSLGEQE